MMLSLLKRLLIKNKLSRVIMRKAVITVYGLVQGVGYRPFAAEAARDLSICGTVCNNGGIVKISAYGDDEALDAYIRRLSSCPPVGSRVDEVVCEYEDATDAPDGFEIVESEFGEEELRYLPADIATCERCERQLFDPSDRRFRYPFISCVSCGPRFSIMREVPYDRERTSMSGFDLCDGCAEDYVRLGDIRRHAQTIACECCGPKVRLYRHVGAEDPISEAVNIIKQGGIVAVKDIGGYHFCFDPFSDEAGRRLREFKNRDQKPFAVMFYDIDEIEKYAFVSEKEEALLKSDARPIVLLDMRDGSSDGGDSRGYVAGVSIEDEPSVERVHLSQTVCGNSDRIGAMLPCNPLQLLLLKELRALVMTSGNRGGEPIIADDKRMFEICDEGGVDGVLYHDREILNPLDDSIFQVVRIPAVVDANREYVQVIRRARGIVPEPVKLPFILKNDVIAAGGDLKSVFALGRKNMAYLSGHYGDLEDVASSRAYREEIASYTRLLGIKPEQAVCDAHPGYISARIIKDYIYNDAMKTGSSEPIDADPDAAIRLSKVGHHYAHVASVIAEHGLNQPVIGLAFDGTGYGDDGTVWGSEFLFCHDCKYERVGHFSSIPMIASDDAAKNAFISLYAYVYAAEKRGLLTSGEIDALFESDSHKNEYRLFCSAADAGINTVSSSSMGRLFDAASAALDICGNNSYEGECAIMLEQAARRYLRSIAADRDGLLSEIEPSDLWAPVQGVSNCETDESETTVKHGSDTVDKCAGTSYVFVADSVFLMASLIKEKLYGEDADRIAFMFHQAIADASVMIIQDAEGRVTESTDTVVLSGGTMCNRVLLSLLIPAVRRAGFKVYINEKVPCGDGGIALGQLCLGGNSL